MKSIVSYPERGDGGNNRYRGNCSPKLVQDLIQQFKVTDICDYMAGSYTTRDAALASGLLPENIHCYDLNHGFDLMSMEIPERPEFVFWHPPYWDIIQYSDNMYSSREVFEKFGITTKNDLSRAKTWEKFVEMQNYCMMKLYASLETGGRVAVLMGDVRKRGRLFSQLCSIVKPGTLEALVIKTQHNCFSDRTVYSNNNFIPIVHEYLMIVRKDFPLMVNYLLTQEFKTDVRDMKGASWRTVVSEVLQSIGREASLDEIYAMVDGHKKTINNPHWKEKIRQTLGRYEEFTSSSRGKWCVAA